MTAVEADPEPTAAPPLAGVRVLELSSYVATPLAGMTLAQLGADVVRVEPVGGAPDRTRLPVSREGTSYYWTSLNQGKRAICVDLATQQGRRIVADLAAEADVVVANAAYSGEVTAEALRARNPGWSTCASPAPRRVGTLWTTRCRPPPACRRSAGRTDWRGRSTTRCPRGTSPPASTSWWAC